MLYRAVMISDFQSTIIVAKRIHDNNVITVYIENVKNSEINVWLFIVCFVFI